MTATERIEREIAHLKKSITAGGFTAAEIRDIEASIKALTELLEKTK